MTLTLFGPLTCAPGQSCKSTNFSIQPPGLALRTNEDQWGERPSVVDYGVDMTGAADSTAAFTAALNASKPIAAPCGTIRVTDTIKVTTAGAKFAGSGDCTLIKYDAPAGTPAKPLIDILPAVVGADLSRFSFDHQGARYAVSQQYDVLTGGVAVIVQADNTRIHDVTGRNGYDNCFMAIRFDSNNAAVRGKPQYYDFRNIRTFTCGLGAAHTGAGIDIGSGSNGTVDGLVDVGSYAAFIHDTGAGANGTFSNLVGIATAYDGVKPSYTFYIGDANGTYTNLQSIGAGYRGLWLDGYAYRTTISNLSIKAPAFEGMLLKGGTSTLSNVIINSPGYGKTAGTVDAVLVDNTAGPIAGLMINGLSVQSEFNTARYGLNLAGVNSANGALVTPGAYPVTGAILNADLGGAVTATNGMPGTFGVVNGAALGGYWTNYTPTVTTGSGAFTTVSASASYLVVGKTVSVRINIQIADKGTATDVRVSLPLPARGTSPLTGIENNATGKGIAGAIVDGTSIATLKFTDGTNAVPASGATYLLTVSGEYQTQ